MSIVNICHQNLDWKDNLVEIFPLSFDSYFSHMNQNRSGKDRISLNGRDEVKIEAIWEFLRLFWNGENGNGSRMKTEKILAISQTFKKTKVLSKHQIYMTNIGTKKEY